MNLNSFQNSLVFIFDSKYVKNLLTLLMGTTLAQLIPVLITPLLARLYNPEQFGMLGFYMGFVSIGVILATGKLELASILPRNDINAIHLLLLSVILALLVSGLVLVGLMIFHGLGLLGYLLPMGILCTSFNNIFLAWLGRKKRYRMLSNTRVMQSGLISTSQVSIGLLFSWSYGLIIADIVGKFLLSTNIMKKRWRKLKTIPFTKIRVFILIKRYKNFLKYNLVASLINNISFQLPYILVPLIFSKSISGFYFLVFRVLMSPISIIGVAILDVFRIQALDNLRKNNECREIFIKTLLLLFTMGIVPTILLIFCGEELFISIFGLEWSAAGKYARIMAPMAFLRLISSPLSYLFILREKLFLDLVLQSLFLFMVCWAMIVGWWYSDSTLLIVLLSFSGCMFYLIQIVVSWKLSGENNGCKKQ